MNILFQFYLHILPDIRNKEAVAQLVEQLDWWVCLCMYCWMGIIASSGIPVHISGCMSCEQVVLCVCACGHVCVSVRPPPISIPFCPVLSPCLSLLLFQLGCGMVALWALSLFLSASLLGCLGLTLPEGLPQPHNLPSSLALNNSDGSLSVDLPMALRVFSVDYHHVQAPFEIVLWIMLASLAKLGESLFNFCSNTRGQLLIRC